VGKVCSKQDIPKHLQEEGGMKKKLDREIIGMEEEEMYAAGGQADGQERQSSAEGEEKRAPKRRRKKEWRFTGCLPAKIAAFFLLTISFLVGTVAIGFCIHLADYGIYTLEDKTDLLKDVLYTESKNILHRTMSYLAQGEVEEAAAFCRDKNIDIQMVETDKKGNETVIWTTGKDYDTDIIMDMHYEFGTVWDEVILDGRNGYKLKENTIYRFYVSIDPEFRQEDTLKKLAETVSAVYNARFRLIQAAAAMVLLFLLSFVFLMCAAGHRNGREGITPGVLTGIHLDVLTVIFGGGAVSFVYIWHELIYYRHDFELICLLAAGGTVLVVWCTVYLMELSLRLKQGKCLSHTLIYVVLRWCGRLLKILARGLKALLNQLPLVLTTLIVYFGVCIVEVFILTRYGRIYSGGYTLWFLGKILLLALVLYIVLMFRKLLEGSRALAEGKGDYRVDTRAMFGGFKEHGENLNSLGQGILRAVEARMKSEHLKTELITNVSHDIKTPLTSIINYADLICGEVAGTSEYSDDNGREDSLAEAAQASSAEPGENSVSEDNAVKPEGSGMEEAGERAFSGKDAAARDARIAEYAQVLLRQSRRMKKLLEDLVEASKATTGNLEVNLEPCEVGVLLSQAVGEFQQKMEEKNLELIARQSQEPVKIMADGRHLWRVFDNLLNNICKYAQEGSRVYLSMEVKEGQVQIIFRNMSKYPLDISPEELEERFVRGDRSRHMEGNGLGLSIAKSLVELQHGRMEIVIDGDLFKVVLGFAVYTKG